MGRDKEVRKKDLDGDGKCFALRRSFVRGCSKIKNEIREKSMRNS